MKNMLEVLKVNENDNVVTATLKGGAKGTIIAFGINVAIWGAVKLIGTKSENKGVKLGGEEA